MSEVIPIVDDQDKLIAYKDRKAVDYTKDIFQSSALWVVNSNGDILLAQRKLTKSKDPGKWGPAVAGTVEKGEDYETNIYKEAEEEIGLTGYKFEKLAKEKLSAPYPYPQFVQWFQVTVDKPIDYFTAQLEEVEKIEWVGRNWLMKDVQENPEKYITSMGRALTFLRRST